MGTFSPTRGMDSTAQTEGPAIAVKDLRVAYGEREILHGISFKVRAGETMVILGGSGSGKSTLLRTLVGLEQPTSGEIRLRGKNLQQIMDAEWHELRKHIGISFQSGALFGSMSVAENVSLPLREHTRLDQSTIDIMVRLKLDQVGLRGFEDYMPSQLSGGMKKRAAVARAMAMDPEILFFDEPSAGLDPIIAAGIDELLLRLKQAFRITIVVVAHRGDRNAGGTQGKRASAGAAVPGPCGGAGTGAGDGLLADFDRGCGAAAAVN